MIRNLCKRLERSNVDVLKRTLSPSFHISVTRVSPGYTTPAKLVISINDQNARKLSFYYARTLTGL